MLMSFPLKTQPQEFFVYAELGVEWKLTFAHTEKTKFHEIEWNSRIFAFSQKN